MNRFILGGRVSLLLVLVFGAASCGDGSTASGKGGSGGSGGGAGSAGGGAGGGGNGGSGGAVGGTGGAVGGTGGSAGGAGSGGGGAGGGGTGGGGAGGTTSDGGAGTGGSDASTSDASDGSATDASDGPPAPVQFTVVASANNLTLSTCGVTPATFANVPAGTYTIKLAASTLSKGAASGYPAVDDFVIVHLPLPVGDPNEDHRFFMLNGVGSTASVTLPATGTIELMFADSDLAANNGQGTVTLEPGGYTATVDAIANVLAWDSGCHSSPATVRVTPVAHKVTLVSSTFTAGAGSMDNFVLVRPPVDDPVQPRRYVILNGVGASADFTPFNNNTVSAWFIGASPGPTGAALLRITDL